MQHKSPLMMSWLFTDGVCVCQGRPTLQMVASVGDDVNYRIGVALPTGFPVQVSGRNYSEGKVM